MIIHSILLFLFNLIIYTSSIEINCNNSLKIITHEPYINEYYSKKLRFLSNIFSYFEALLNFQDVKATTLSWKDTIMKSLKDELGNEPYSSELYDIFDNFINKSNIYFNNIMDTINVNKNSIKNKFGNIKNKESSFEYLIILFEYETIAENIGLFIEENPNLLKMLYLEGKNQNETELITNLINFLTDYIDIFRCIGVSFSKNNNDIYIALAEYSLNNENFTTDFLKLFIDNKEMASFLMDLIDDKSFKSLFNYTNNHPEDVEYLYNITQEDEKIKQLLPIMISKIENKEELIFDLFTNENILKYPDLITIFISIGLSFAQDGNSDAGSYVDLLVELVRGGARAFQYNNYDFIEQQLTPECIKFINYTIFENKSQSKFFIYKALIDTSKSLNDLLIYDNCLKKPPIISEINIADIDKLGAVPAFVFATMDNSVKKNKNKYKIGTQLEECYYISSICLPQGIKNETNQNIYNHCTDKDYSHLIRYIFNFLSNLTETEINAISIHREAKITDKISIGKIFFIKLIPFYIILIPFILYIILIFSKKKKYKPKKKEEHLENLLSDDSNNKEQKNSKKEELKNRQNNPRWIIYLDEFFNFNNNGKELFNFESKITICNNTNGLKYIGGLMGISILLTILGQIYLILYNLPMKEFGKANFYSLYKGIFYIFFFIGLRYSPRIIFSCSGYILSFKFLSFIDKESNHYFLKFFSRQFYKYIMLVVIILFGRHSYYPLVTILFDIQPIIELFNENVLSIPKDSSNFFLSLLTIKSFDMNKIDSRVKHYLTDFFWMPINEIFFFIIGTILISIGYKYKLRIDYFIIIAIIVFYLLKFLSYYIYYYNTEKIYTTLYYYIFDYGELMLSPLFNLPYYLIGMYFGLINYTVEKGVTSLYRENMYKFIHNKKDNEIDNNEIDNNEDEDKEEIVSRITTLKSIETSYQLDELDEDELNKLQSSSKNQRNSLGHKGMKNLKDSIINKNKKNKEIKKEINTNNNNDNITQELAKEIKAMPFLISPVIIKNWHDKRTDKKYFFYILVSILTLIIVFFIVIHYIIISHYEKEIDGSDDQPMRKILFKLSLEKVICDHFLNFIYLIDIELVVLFVQWGFFILLLKQHFIIEFFNHIYWTFFNKFYFSFLLSCNNIILYIFFESETVVKLNAFNLWLYYFISTVFIFIVTIIIYITIELPLKKISKYLFSNNYKINFGEEFIEKNKEEHNDDNKSDDEEDDEDDE